MENSYDINICFECGNKNDIHQHHIVPQSLGGIKTIPLCSECHSKVHGKDLTHWTALVNEGRKKYKENGGRFGRKKGSVKPIEQLLKEHADIVKFLNQNISIRNIMAITNKSSGTVQNIKKLLK